MKIEVDQLLGREISGALIKAHRQGDISPSSMLLLVLEGNCTYEFYSGFGRIRPVYMDLGIRGDSSQGLPTPESIREILDWGGDRAENEITVWQDAAGRQWRKYGGREPECTRDVPAAPAAEGQDKA